MGNQSSKDPCEPRAHRPVRPAGWTLGSGTFNTLATEGSKRQPRRTRRSSSNTRQKAPRLMAASARLKLGK